MGQSCVGTWGNRHRRQQSGLSSGLSANEQKEARTKAVSLLAQAVGAIVLSRACPDDALLADEILDSCKLSLAI